MTRLWSSSLFRPFRRFRHSTLNKDFNKALLPTKILIQNKCYTPVSLAFDSYLPMMRYNLPDIIFVHGMSQNKSTWKGIAQRVAEQTHRAVYAVDLPDHGDNAWTDGSHYTNMDYARDMEYFMEERKIKSAVFVGHCLGGLVSMHLACYKPEKVTSVIVEDIQPKFPTSTDHEDFVQEVMERLIKQKESLHCIPPTVDILEAKRIFLELFIKEHGEEKTENVWRGRPLEEELIKKDDHYAWHFNVDLFIDLLREKKMLSKYQGVFKKPSLFICGAKSRLNVLADRESTFSLFPRAVFHELEDGNHRIHQFYPIEFSKIVIDFINNT